MKNTNAVPAVISLSKAFVFVCALTFSSGSLAVWKGDDLSLVAKVGTLGAGAEVKYKLHDRFTGRLAYTKFDYDYDYEDEDDGTKYDGKLDFNTLGLFADWHPFGSGFRLSAGLVSNGNELRARANGEFKYQDVDYTGNANLLMDFKSTAPYAGFGWSSQNDGLSFDFELGALFQGAPLVSIKGNGKITDSSARSLADCSFAVNSNGDVSVTGDDVLGACPDLQVDLGDEQDELRDELDAFKIYPVLSIGIHYRF